MVDVPQPHLFGTATLQPAGAADAHRPPVLAIGSLHALLDIHKTFPGKSKGNLPHHASKT